MILLTAINAKYIHSNLALYSLMSYGAKYKDHMELVEYTINHSKETILQGIYQRQPDVVAFSCYIWNISYVLEIAVNLKKVMPQVSIVVGGPEVSYDAQKVLEENAAIDMVMMGEGEQTFLEYMEYLFETGKELKDIKGIAYWDQGKVQITTCRPLMDLDQVVFPYENIEQLENRILYYETSRGCPFSCSYCLSSIDKKVRLRSFELVEKELDFFLEKKVPQVKFVDRTFNCNHEHAYQIWEKIGASDNGITNFHFEIAADLLRSEDIQLLQKFRPGLVQLEIGVQSTNPKTIQAIRRQMNLEKVASAVKEVRAGRNIHQHLDLIAGLPYEDLASFCQSFKDVYEMKPDQLQLGFLKVLKGSYMEEAKEEYEAKFDEKPPYEVLSTKWLSYGEVIRLKVIEEMVEVYYNSFQFTASMAYVHRYYPNMFDFFDEIGMYYKEKAYFEGAKTRISRYTILLEFFETNKKATKQDREDFLEVLTYDLFSRENVKNPPQFVREVSKEEKNLIRQFYDREAMENRFLKGYEGLSSKQRMNMTELRRFSIDMDQLIEKGHVVKTLGYYLFDYKNRDPLSYCATIENVGGAI